MRTAAALLAVLQALAVQGIRIVQGNDDGWAELYARSFEDALRASGHDVYGIDTFGPQLWDGAAPELAVSGPNVGANLWLAVPFSGTVGAAAYAAHTARIPALAFSGADHGRLRWDTYPVPTVSEVYARLAANLTDAVVASGKPYLPDDVFLNVNFPDVDDACPDAASFKWVLSRINPGLFSPKDVEWCGDDRLPTEHHVHDQRGCYISVSIGDAKDKTTVNDVAKQQIVLNKLKM
ncbi:5'/3'-nucleotidase SurE [Cordyceps javanica]|uniref:5'/3'-nucleotidase SurE n=1 Tax=Cordyceps javanica TaxID=43265 RepID=A0A545UMC5_9HYPO|nr:5'/3'-nucleotidase SurE [Cordyceps javanica]